MSFVRSRTFDNNNNDNSNLKKVKSGKATPRGGNVAHSDDNTKANVEQKKADMVTFLTAVLPPLKTDNPTLDEAGFINEVKGLYDQVAAEQQ